MRYHYCTLFDVNYLDKGIVTIDSLKITSPGAAVYILCMDDRTYAVLSDYYRDSGIPLISMEAFLDDRLKKMKKERSRTEFCWSCSAYLVQYILDRYRAECCTYIDADMCFYTDPGILVDEMFQSGCSVQIIEHRFPPGARGKKLEKTSGKFCVEFNSFRNDKDGRMVLAEWRQNIFRQCSMEAEKGLGDQFYLNKWPSKYGCVHILEHLGAGIAPWNISRYKIRKTSPKGLWVSFDGKGSHQAVFYHFHWMQYEPGEGESLCVWRYFRVDKKTVYRFYIPYIRKIQAVRKMLEEEYAGILKQERVLSSSKELDFMGNIRERFGSVKFRDLITQAAWKCREWIHGNADLIDLDRLGQYESNGSRVI